MGRHQVTWSIDNVAYEHPTLGSILVTAEGTISDYHDAVMYLPNGDPGYPAEGGETYVTSCSAIDEESCLAVELAEDDIPREWWEEQAAEHSYDPRDEEPPEDD